MNKILIFLILALAPLHKVISQEISEENYQKINEKILKEYELDMSKISSFYKSNPEKKDSLSVVVTKMEKTLYKKLAEATVKYASIPSGIENLYRQRSLISKDTLLDVLKKLPKEIQDSDYGKTIKLHIDSKQVGIGDNFYNFHATDSNGNPFQLSNLKGNDILLLYGGLGCMGEDGRVFLKKFYNTMYKTDFKIVVFNSCSNVEELKTLKDQYQLDFIFVDDFKKDHSPMKIIYGAQSTPTCFIINKHGKIVEKSIGLPIEKLNDTMTKASR